MSFTIVECEQRSQDWFMARLGRVTSSVASDMLSARKDKTEAAGRRNLRIRLMLERVTGLPQEVAFRPSDAMLKGIEREKAAAALYEGLTGQLLRHCGFLRHDTVMCGASLDGYVGNFEGCVEIKSPLPATHWDYIKLAEQHQGDPFKCVPNDYLCQARHQMYVSGAQWCDFFSYNPDFPEKLRSRVVRIPRVEAEMQTYALALSLFNSEIDKEVQEARRLLEEDAA